MKTLLTAALLVLLAGRVPAYGQIGIGGGQFSYGLARCEKDKVQVRQIFVYNIPALEKRTKKDKDGKEVEYQVSVLKTMVHENTREVEVKDLTALGGDGKKIDAKKLPGLLEKETTVLVGLRGQKVNPLYFKILKKEALVLVVPPAFPGRPMPAKEPDKKADLPKGPAPQVGTAAIDGKTFRFTERSEYSYNMNLVHKAGKDGAAQEETVPVKYTTVSMTIRELAARYVRVYGRNDKPLAAKDASDRLAKETPVLLSTNGQKVDPFYLRVVKKETLTAVLPAASFGRPIEARPRPMPRPVEKKPVEPEP
jgi:hypothetical protein